MLISRGHKSYITCVSILDTHIFTGSADSTIKMWDAASTECLFTYSGHTSKIHKILVTPDLLFSTSNDRTAKVRHSNLTKNDQKNKPLIKTFRVSAFHNVKALKVVMKYDMYKDIRIFDCRPFVYKEIFFNKLL